MLGDLEGEGWAGNMLPSMFAAMPTRLSKRSLQHLHIATRLAIFTVTEHVRSRSMPEMKEGFSFRLVSNSLTLLLINRPVSNHRAV